MSDFRYAPIYGRNPWLMVEDADEVADFFRNSGTPFVSHRRDIVHFGSQPHVYWIESGLVASSATTDVDKVRWIGLFSRRTLLGSVRAIGHGKAAMTLMATAVTDVSGFAIPLELYARWVSENPERERAMLLNCIAKSECQVEGVLVNDLCSVDDRVEIAVAVLFRAAGITEAQLPAALPWDIPVSDIASLVHAERAMTSRAVAGWSQAVCSSVRAGPSCSRRCRPQPASGGASERPRWSSVLPGTAGLGRRKLREYDGARHQHAAEELPLGEHFAEQ